jgi:hypothetical protein
MQKLMCVVVGGMLLLPAAVRAQYGSVTGRVAAGETIPVRMGEPIDVTRADGRIFPGTVDADVFDRDGQIAIPAGSPVELTARPTSDDSLVLDLESIVVNGQRFAVAADAETATSGQGIGNNDRTAKYVGGGAILGSIIGAVVGGGKGAAVGAVAGGAVGASAQVATQGRALSVPEGAVVTFRLDRGLNVGVADTGYTRDGHHYHPY